MELYKIASYIDHTVLSPLATWEEIREALDLAIRYHAASACIPPSFIARAKSYVGDSLPLCTVIGFPNGYNTTATKVYEAKNAIERGADEIDMVINLGWVKNERYTNIEEEIVAVREATEGNILKVIIETALLTQDEKINLAHIVTSSGADYIKTSTGFNGGGATVADVVLLLGQIGATVKVKASGGISTLEEARQFINLGVGRIGSSKVLKELEKIDKKGLLEDR